jgi:predicted TIM-barrel fold metal-dependent hydrolase
VLDDVFVIDAVSHGYHVAPEVQVPPPVGGTWADAFLRQGYFVFCATQPEGGVLPYERFLRAADADLVGRALFAESNTDATIYHHVPLDRLFGQDGSSPIFCGQEMRERWPGRVALYGGVSPFRADAIERIDMLVEEYGVVGIKMYPIDLVEGRVMGVDMSDPEHCFPLYEHMLKRGIRAVGIHKAIPLGPVGLKPYGVSDMDIAAMTFPDLTFEIVHGGWAFLEETVMLLGTFQNIVINLEGTTLLLPKSPRRFAQILGEMLWYGGGDRIMWATGTMLAHPKPMLDSFWELEMPEDLIEGYNYPPLTKEIKRKILGENAARILGLDINQMKQDMAGDEFSQQTELAPMWSADADGWDIDAYRTHTTELYERLPKTSVERAAATLLA